MQELKKLLKKYWGYESFRPLQEEVITSVLEGHDTLVLFPTGGGKSLCYQLPALACEGVCLVVSPLIALMKDQVQQLNNRGIKAACLVSGMSAKEQEVVLNNCIYGTRRVKLLYVSPERLRHRPFIENFRRMQVSLIAVDEAHCISQWGYEFRPPYLEIAKIRQYHPTVPLIALTATATPQVVEDIQRNLLFRNGKVFQTSFSRGNIAFMVLYEEDKMNRLLRIAAKVQGCGIVYVRNRRSTQEVANFLTAKGVGATFYHAGLSGKDRDLRQRMWMENKVQVMVATNAFGMGVDKSDVRFVVHLDIPSSVEAYYQEAGRAGRDGLKSYAALLYDKADVANLKQNFALEYPPLQKILDVYRAVCNYYQIPVGSGADSVFPLDIVKLCETYGFKIAEFYAAVRYLEREGLLQMPDREEVESSVFIPASREEVYRFQVENQRYGDLVQTLLRMYGGMFSGFVPISEMAIAKRIYSTEDQVTKYLLHLDALKVITYKKKQSGPVIYFPTARVETTSLQYSDKNYQELKSAAYQRLGAMLRYVGEEHCRARQLLGYFGESTEEDCGNCDYCLQHRGNNAPKDLADAVIALLREHGPMEVKQVVALLPDVDEEALRQTIHNLLDVRKIGMNKDFQLVR